MTSDRDQITDSPSRRFGRWALALAFAASVHGGVAALGLVAWPQDDLPETIEGAILIELAPLPVAAEADAADVAPVAPVETAAVAPPVEETAQTKPIEETPPVEPSPLAPAPEVTLPPPPPEPVKESEPVKVPEPQPVAEKVLEPDPEPAKVETVEPEPQPEAKPAETAPPPVAAVAPQVSAPPALDAAPAPVTAAPKEGMSPEAQKVRATYGGKLSAHVFRHQRYPAEARRNKIGGEATIAFSMDRTGKVTGTRIVKSSGFPVLDEAAAKMIERASPLPAPPAEVEGEAINREVTVKFRVK